MKFLLQKHVVAVTQTPVRLSDYSYVHFDKLPSRKALKKAIKKGAISVNGAVAKTATLIQPNDIIEHFELPDDIQPIYELDLEVIYEDDYLAVIRKPGGLLSNGFPFKTAERALAHNLQASTQKDSLRYPKIVHRLDRATTGLLLCSKTAQTHIHLARQFQNKTIQKRYQAVVIGATPKQWLFTQAIDNQKAITELATVVTSPSKRFEQLSLVNLYPLTGRTHQLRKHCAEAGFAILGDALYGTEEKLLRQKGLFLAAVQIQFEHPSTGESMNIEISAPNKFELYRLREARRGEGND